MSKETKICHTCGLEKPLPLFPKWRAKCKACKSAENSARLKERYVSDVSFAETVKRRSAEWQRINAERSNEYRRRRHERKMAAGDERHISTMDAAQRRYRNSEKGRAAIKTRMHNYAEMGRDKEWRKARRQRPESRVSQMLGSARARASKANVDFALAFDDVYPAVAAGKCQVSGLPFDLAPHEKHRTHPFSPSIDRIDSSKGYILGNVRVVCWWVNCACGAWGLEAILPAMRAIVDANPKTGV